MKRILTFCLVGALSLGITLADSPKKLSCSKPDQAASASRTAETGKLRCSLTGKTVDECCCVQREGKTHCTLADKDVANCCCKPVSEKAQK